MQSKRIILCHTNTNMWSINYHCDRVKLVIRLINKDNFSFSKCSQFILTIRIICFRAINGPIWTKTSTYDSYFSFGFWMDSNSLSIVTSTFTSRESVCRNFSRIDGCTSTGMYLFENIVIEFSVIQI